ncbi:ABC transporter permease [Candidatus Bathyarchaeota archaeon]|nr:ABC transporter permease [Candidatus Bathyarchaeota archaeon]
MNRIPLRRRYVKGLDLLGALGVDVKEVRLILRILSRNPLSLAGSVIILAFFATALFIAVAGVEVLPYDPYAVNIAEALQPPSSKHLLGTDNLGRDILSRIIAGTVVDAQVSVVVVAFSLAVGGLLGAVAGFYGGKIDEIVMRVTDVFLAFPGLILALAIAAALGPSLLHVMEALLVVWWPTYARLSRAEALSVKENQYIEAAKASGLRDIEIVFRHVIPNILSPLMIYATLDIGSVILNASVLSYIGLGAQHPQAEWGRMVFDGQSYLMTQWWLPIFPGIAIMVTVLGFNLLGDGLRDALDPRLRRIVRG